MWRIWREERGGRIRYYLHWRCVGAAQLRLIWAARRPTLDTARLVYARVYRFHRQTWGDSMTRHRHSHALNFTQQMSRIWRENERQLYCLFCSKLSRANSITQAVENHREYICTRLRNVSQRFFSTLRHNGDRLEPDNLLNIDTLSYSFDKLADSFVSFY